MILRAAVACFVLFTLLLAFATWRLRQNGNAGPLPPSISVADVLRDPTFVNRRGRVYRGAVAVLFVLCAVAFAVASFFGPRP